MFIIGHQLIITLLHTTPPYSSGITMMGMATTSIMVFMDTTITLFTKEILLFLRVLVEVL